MNLDELRNWIKVHEGYDNKPYIDIVGKLTIGYGRNIEENGVSREEAEMMLSNDIKRSIKDLSCYVWYLNQPEDVQMALVNMCFNLGMPRLLTFRKMINALINKDYKRAALEALDSKWAKQVGKRAKDIALMISESN